MRFRSIFFMVVVLITPLFGFSASDKKINQDGWKCGDFFETQSGHWVPVSRAGTVIVHVRSCPKIFKLEGDWKFVRFLNMDNGKAEITNDSESLYVDFSTLQFLQKTHQVKK